MSDAPERPALSEDAWNTQIVFQVLCKQCFDNSKSRGFYDGPERNVGEVIALMHSELSECLEALRTPDTADKYGALKPLESSKTPGFTAVEEELADVLIRIFDFCGSRPYDLGGAVLAKMKYNASRPYKHGKEF